MSPGGEPANLPAQVYSQHLADLLQREHDRMATLIARGEVIARTVLSILTVLVAVTTLAVGASFNLDPHIATWSVLAAAALLGLASLGFASLAQAAPSRIDVTDDITMAKMTGIHWNKNDDDPLRIVAKRVEAGVNSLRAANETRACYAKWALVSQFAFIVVVLSAVVTEVVIQL